MLVSLYSKGNIFFGTATNNFFEKKTLLLYRFKWAAYMQLVQSRFCISTIFISTKVSNLENKQKIYEHKAKNNISEAIRLAEVLSSDTNKN